MRQIINPQLQLGEVDIGAVETVAPTDSFHIVDTPIDESDGDYGEGDLSLREAVELANASPGRATIVMSPDLADSTLVLSQGQISITDSVWVACVLHGLVS